MAARIADESHENENSRSFLAPLLRMTTNVTVTLSEAKSLLLRPRP
jgi:hypothetical protein